MKAIKLPAQALPRRALEGEGKAASVNPRDEAEATSEKTTHYMYAIHIGMDAPARERMNVLAWGWRETLARKRSEVRQKRRTAMALALWAEKVSTR